MCWRHEQLPHVIGVGAQWATVFVCVCVCGQLFGLQCFDAVGWAAGRASGLKKTERWGAGVVICLERGADLHVAQLMPLPLTVSCFSKIQIGFAFLVPAHLGSPGQRAVKRMCVCVFIRGGLCHAISNMHQEFGEVRTRRSGDMQADTHSNR